MIKYFLGLDLGQSQDYTALAILERLALEPVPSNGFDLLPEEDEIRPRPRYACSHLQRYPLGTRYPAIVEAIGELMQKSELRGQCHLVVDASGVGRPVCDLFSQAHIGFSGVTITGGDAVSNDGNLYRIPKRILVSTLQVLLQSERLQVAPNPLREVLVKELLSFQVTATEAANDTYGGRMGTHDDLVLAVALAAWKAESTGLGTISQAAIRVLAGLED